VWVIPKGPNDLHFVPPAHKKKGKSSNQDKSHKSGTAHKDLIRAVVALDLEDRWTSLTAILYSSRQEEFGS
jgi:hypothetical protein